MNSNFVSKIIAADLADNPEFFNSHSVNLQVCLQSPTMMRFENSFSEGEYLQLWLVLKERPGTEEGYLVVFDESRSAFGLAVYGKKDPVFIGYYGSFTNTLSGM